MKKVDNNAYDTMKGESKGKAIINMRDRSEYLVFIDIVSSEEKGMGLGALNKGLGPAQVKC